MLYMGQKEEKKWPTDLFHRGIFPVETFSALSMPLNCTSSNSCRVGLHSKTEKSESSRKVLFNENWSYIFGNEVAIALKIFESNMWRPKANLTHNPLTLVQKCF